MHSQDIISQSISNENLVIYEIYGHLVKFKIRSGEISSCQSPQQLSGDPSRLLDCSTYLHNRSSEARLNGLALMYVHPNEEIDIQRVIQRFASAGNRRSMLL